MAIAEHLQRLGQSDRGHPADVGDFEGTEKAPLRIELEIIADIQPSPGDRAHRATCIATVRFVVIDDQSGILVLDELLDG